MAMTEQESSSSSATATSEFAQSYAAYCTAKAEYDLMVHGTQIDGENLADEFGDVYARTEIQTLVAMLLHPVSNAKELAQKLAVYADAQAYQGGFDNRAIAQALARDALHVASAE
jgi:hypothetical protein